MNPYMLPSWKSGDGLDHSRFNQLSKGISAGLALKVDPSTGLTLRSDRTGQRLGHARPSPIWGTLAGSSSPYTFTEAIESASSGAWASGTRTGTAYEVNGAASLGSKVARLYPDRVGAWRFQWRPSGGGGGPCHGGTISPTIHMSFGLLNGIGGCYATRLTRAVAQSSLCGYCRSATGDGLGHFTNLAVNVFYIGSNTWSVCYRADGTCATSGCDFKATFSSPPGSPSATLTASDFTPNPGCPGSTSAQFNLCCELPLVISL